MNLPDPLRKDLDILPIRVRIQLNQSPQRHRRRRTNDISSVLSRTGHTNSRTDGAAEDADAFFDGGVVGGCHCAAGDAESGGVDEVGGACVCVVV